MNTRFVVDEITIEESCGNPYRDLGLPAADVMFEKAMLADQMAQTIKHRRFTQQRAAEIVNMPQSKFSEVLRGKFRGISQARMIVCLHRLSRHIQTSTH